MDALQAQAATSGELAARFGVSPRHIRRTIADLVLENKVIRQRDGRDFLYSLAAAVVEEDATTTITAPAGTADIRGHNVRDRDLGHSSDNDGIIADIRGHDLGHEKHQSSKNRYRNRRRDASGAGHPHKALRGGPEFGPYRRDDRTGLYPHELAYYEIDMVQFVLIDRTFRDILLRRSKEEKSWQVWENRGLTWIRVEDRHLALQVGKTTVTFYSDDPGDMSSIAAWARETFAGNYDNIESLVSRIRYPQSLSHEELCVVVTDPAVIANIRISIEKDARNGIYALPSPNESDPALKIYERDDTMRVEFIATNHAQAVRALGMRENLMNNLPRMQKTPGLFWEFIQKYYSALHHPIIVDVGGHEFLAALGEMLGFVKQMETDHKEERKYLVSKITTTPSPEDMKLRELRDAIEALESSSLGDIIRTFRDLLNVEEAPTKVYLAAWAIWKGRHCKGRVNKTEIASMLLRQNDPLTVAEIAAALPVLRTAGLLQEDPSIEICFSAAGREIAEILMAKQEGL